MFAQFKPGTTAPARSVLDSLMTSVGHAGLAALSNRPGLSANVDQHAAAVRESLLGFAGPGLEPRPVPATALAAYAEGVRDAARKHGWLPPAGPVDWSASDWVLTRLLAVCLLARPNAAGTAAG